MNSLWSYLSDVEQGKRQKPWVYVAGLLISGIFAWLAFSIGEGRLTKVYTENERSAAVILGWASVVSIAVYIFLCVCSIGGWWYRRVDKPLDENFVSAIAERVGTFGRGPKKVGEK